jgi:polyphosphate kinase
MKARFRNREISWLSFNGRVLQEAADPTVPLLERVRFLGIFSSNLDEFFRVRVAFLKRLVEVGKPAQQVVGDDPQKVLKKIHRIVLQQQADFEAVYRQILQELAQENIYIIDERQLTDEQAAFVKSYVQQKVRPVLIPLMINQLSQFPALKDHAIYLAVCLSSKHDAAKTDYALIELPTNVLSRFLILPKNGDKEYVILLDDVIRHCLPDIFSIFNFDHFAAYTIKLTRDAELDIEDNLAESYLQKIAKSLRQRKFGTPVRFVYDCEMPEHLWRFLIKRMKLHKAESNFIPGGRYHNFKDFMDFPQIGPARLRYLPLIPLSHKEIDQRKSVFNAMDKRDILLHYPYQSFDHLIDLLREAAIDPQVTSIKMTLYRVAKHSQVINALINAAKNGKMVTGVMELQARFDEEHNVQWAQTLQEEGVRVIESVPGLKVHAKLLLITRMVQKKHRLYATIGTGNFNETTAKIYSDHSLFTTDTRITAEVQKVFDFLEKNYRRGMFRHLLVSPFNMRRQLIRCINREIKHAQRGNEAYIILKVNNLADQQLIKKLYEASQAGVEIKLMVRGMFALIPEVEGLSDHIHATCIVDRFLEHSRLMVFGAGGQAVYYLSSADCMGRNFDQRVEVACPIYDQNIQQEIRDFLHMQWQDNVKTRILDEKLDNHYQRFPYNKKLRAQEKLYEYCAARDGGEAL